MGLEDPLEMALVGKTQRMRDHGQCLPFAQPPAGSWMRWSICQACGVRPVARRKARISW